MAYATLTDMNERFGADELIELTDRDNNGAVDSSVVDKALEDASALADGYLAGQHDLPLSQPSALLIRIVCDIARYYLYDEISEGAPRDRFNDALRQLKDIAAGKLSLQTGGGQTGGASSADVLAAECAPSFDLDGY